LFLNIRELLGKLKSHYLAHYLFFWKLNFIQLLILKLKKCLRL